MRSRNRVCRATRSTRHQLEASQHEVRRVKKALGVLLATLIATLLWRRAVLMNLKKECVAFPLYAKYSEIERGFVLDDVPTETEIRERKLQLKKGGGGYPLWRLSTWFSSGRLHYIELIVGGTPFLLDIDTGSGMTWLHCKWQGQKSSRVGPNDHYQPVRRESHLVDCRSSECSDAYHDPDTECRRESKWVCYYHLQYADGFESRGIVVNDSVTLRLSDGHILQTPTMFGCGFEQIGCEYNPEIIKNDLARGESIVLKTDGMIGLTRSVESFPSQLSSKGIVRNVIGHCLLGRTHKGRRAGFLFFGDKAIPNFGLRWTKMLEFAEDPPVFTGYEAELDHVKYGRKMISVTGDDKRVVFDTGSSGTYLVTNIYEEILYVVSRRAKLLHYTKMKPPDLRNTNPMQTVPRICWSVWPDSDGSYHPNIREFDSIIFEFKPYHALHNLVRFKSTSSLEIPPTGFLISNKIGSTLCFGPQEEKTFPFNTLGAHTLTQMLIVYDNERFRIGWKPNKNCEQPYHHG